MLTLNFGSEALKKEVKYRRIYNLVKKIGFLLIFLFLLLSIALYISHIFIRDDFNRIVSETTLVTSYSQKYSTKLREINSDLRDASEIQNNYTTWTKVLDILANIKPKQVTFFSIKIDSSSNTLVLSGVSATRDDLLNFKQGLDNSNIFFDIQSPIKNILEKSNISFDISAKIKTDELNKYETE